MSPTGYKNLITDFHLKTGKNYTKKQMKNRWDDLKAVYSAWIYYNDKAIGLGWDPIKLTITADEDQWAEMIKFHKPIKGFGNGPPKNLDLLEVMFQKANVDGKSSVMPGVELEGPVQADEDIVDLDIEDDETPTPSPLAPPKGKRGAATIACSPKKTKNNPVQKDFKRFVDHVISEDRSEASSNVPWLMILRPSCKRL